MYAFLFTLAMVALPAVAQQPIKPADFTTEPTRDGIVIQDPDAPVSFRVPPGWILRQGQRWGDHETTLWFQESDSQALYSFYYQYPLNPPLTVDADTALREAIENKVTQRRDTFPDYRVRAGSIRKQKIGGLAAMSYIGDFTAKGLPQQECMLRVLGKTTKGHFFLMLPANADIEGALRKFEAIAATLRIP